jgi:hypothetical protein
MIDRDIFTYAEIFLCSNDLQRSLGQVLKGSSHQIRCAQKQYES